jgi:hypothetical protein
VIVAGSGVTDVPPAYAGAATTIKSANARATFFMTSSD